MQIKDTLIIIDIDKTSVSENTIKYLSLFYMEYQDTRHKEHLLNVLQCLEDQKDDESTIGFGPEIVSEVKELIKLCNEHNAAYIRFTEG